MDISTKSRAELRAYFVRNAIPTESNFRDFIEGVLVPKDDGLSKSAGRPLSIEAATTADQAAIHLYERFTSAQAPNWVLSLLPGMVSGSRTVGRGFGLSTGVSGSKARLFVEESTGNVGIGTVYPGNYLLNVAGSLNASGGITAGGGIVVAAGQPLQAGGPITASQGATVSGGVLAANGGITVAAGQPLQAGGPITASQGATISGGALNATQGATISGGVLNANGGLTVPAGQALTAGGPINANASITVAPGQPLNAGGPITASQGATIAGVLNVNCNLNIAAGQVLSVGGTLNASAAVNVAAGQPLNAGGALNVTGLLTANGGLNVAAGQALNAGGPVFANAGATISGGMLSANAGLSVAAGQPLNAFGPVNALGGLNIAAGQVLNAGGPVNVAGQLNANGGLAVGTATTGDLTVGTASANKTLSVNGPLNVTQLTTLSGGSILTGEITLNGNTNLNESSIYLRNKPDRSHGIGYCGPATTFQARSLDGPVIFGYGGGGLGTTSPPFNGVDGAMLFDGSTGHIQVPSINLDLSQGFTIEAAVLYGSFNNWSRIIDFGNGPSADNILLANSSATSTLALSSFQVGTDKQVTATNVLQLNTWVHLCATLDATGKVTLYMNGNVVGSGQSQLPRNVVRTINYIGRSNWGGDAYFNGKMANVRIWQRALSQQEVQNAMTPSQPFLTNGVLSSWVTGLAGFWPLNETSGTTARDYSGKNNHGTIQGKVTLEGKQRLMLTWDSQNTVTVPTSGVLAARFRPTTQSFQVGGDFIKWYPILFFDDGWDDGPLELTLSRTNINQDSTARGATICVIRAHCNNWGHGCAYWKILDHYYSVAQFVGGVGVSTRSRYVIVWLRGGNTGYQWYANHPARLIDNTPCDPRVLTFPNSTETETYPAKTSPDANLGASTGI